MQAVAAMNQKGINPGRTIVAGKGDSQKWRSRASSLGVERFITFAGPTDRVARFRNAADYGAHLSFYDPCSRVVLEGMLSGVPCVTTRFNGAAEIIDPRPYLNTSVMATLAFTVSRPLAVLTVWFSVQFGCQFVYRAWLEMSDD